MKNKNEAIEMCAWLMKHAPECIEDLNGKAKEQLDELFEKDIDNEVYFEHDFQDDEAAILFRLTWS